MSSTAVHKPIIDLELAIMSECLKKKKRNTMAQGTLIVTFTHNLHKLISLSIYFL